MRPITARIATLSLGALLLGTASPVAAFSVLAHQAVVDQCWDDTIAPALRHRFPNAGPAAIAHARAYAHGGSHIADLGYFPFGNQLFTDLVHYVRSGEFVGNLVALASTVDEYAFALGAVSHYVTDSIGHPEVTNRTVSEVYPKLRKEYGNVVTYADDHSAHLQTEFRFDVLEVAHNPQSLDLFTHALDFEVAEPLLDRAFRRTYGLGLDDVFTDKTIAITTYRWAFRDLIHEATGIAWQLYRADIKKLDASMTPAAFVYDLSREDFEKEFGSAYREPGFLAKSFAFLVKLVPNVGPFKRMPYKPLPADARERFDENLRQIVTRYRTVVRAPRPLALTNLNLDTGHPTRRGDYEPADDAYADLLEKLGNRHFAGVPRGLRADVLRFYASAERGTATREDDEGDAAKLRRELTRLAESARGH